MVQKQAHQLFTSVTGSADYRDARFIAVRDTVIRSFFHSAQCVFGFDLIANDICGTLVNGMFVVASLCLPRRSAAKAGEFQRANERL